MKYTKLIVIGAYGMLGRYIYSYIDSLGIIEVIPVSRSDFDVVKDKDYIKERLFDKYLVDDKTVIFNAVGQIPQKRPLNSEVYYNCNTLFPLLLSKFCKQYKCKLIHPSTDCVFSGKRGMYTEQDTPDPSTVYGKSKFLGEPLDHTVIRTSIIGECPSNSSALLEWVRCNASQSLFGYGNHYWNGITCLEFAKITHYIIVSDLFWTGVRHIFSPDIVSKAILIEYISDIYDLTVDVTNVDNLDICNRTLKTIYPKIYNVPEIYDQILELKSYIFTNNPKT